MLQTHLRVTKYYIRSRLIKSEISIIPKPLK